MFCSNCGHELAPDALFCGSCGANIMALKEHSALERLQNLTTVTPGATALSDRERMLSTIEEIERDFGSEVTPSLADALAGTILCYVTFHVRGDDRKPFFERAVQWYRLSGNKAALGCLLVEERLVRDVKEAISLLGELYAKSKSYEPALCFYAEALYKDGQYIRAHEAAVHVHELAALQFDVNSIPSMPMQTAAKAQRAEARRLKKAARK